MLTMDRTFHVNQSCRAIGFVCRALLLAMIGGCGGAMVKPVAVAKPQPEVATQCLLPPGKPTTMPAKFVRVSPPTSAASSVPYLLHLPGIGGKRTIDVAMTKGLVEGGFQGDIEIYDWTENDEGLHALIEIQRNKKEAQLIAQKITQHFDMDPSAPIYLTCHSGGGGLAIWAMEDLPERVKIHALAMMSPALSPTYDMSKAFSHLTGKAYVFSSLDDQLVLGTGCRLFGTIDGVKTDAAGRVGFSAPPGADAGQYAKLVPMPYRPQWLQLGDRGDHVGGMTHRFARLVLAPLLLSGSLPAIAEEPVSATSQP
jgi:hypothetical protein